MKSLAEKKDPNLVEKAKVIAEAGNVCKSAMNAEAKNTEEYLETLREILKSNSNITKEYRQFAEKEIDYYMKALDTATSEEERKKLYNRMETLNESVTKMAETEIQENKDIKERATKDAKENKELVWNILKVFGIGTLAILGAVVSIKETPDIINKVIDKK